MGTPIRGLDEFDVFMVDSLSALLDSTLTTPYRKQDSVNRMMSTKLLIDAAKVATTTQFILISPQALAADLKFGNEVKVTRLVCQPLSILASIRTDMLVNRRLPSAPRALWRHEYEYHRERCCVLYIRT